MDVREQLQHTLGSTYTLERELNGGGMSRVFVATETRLKRSVVVKVMSSELAAEISSARFEREIQVAASLQQANIVPVLSAGETNGVPYYTMPYVIDESLRAQLAARGALPIDEAVGVLRDVARALSYAHAHGVVHRDIKPDNVLLSHGAAVVTDFGIAKAIVASRTAEGPATLTQSGTTIGTPAYMAPEQIANDPHIDAKADIYAFGCMAYELLTGHPPFVGQAPQHVLAAHLTETPKPVRELRADTPVSLSSLIARCLAKNAADRPASADEVLHVLGTVTSRDDPPPSTPRSQGVRKQRRVSFATALVLILGAALGTWWRGHRTSPPQVDRSIAVLPLANLSGIKENNYFSEGLAEELTIALGRAGLRVIGRGTARTLVEERHLDAQAIGKELKVGSVLQGAVQWVGDRLRITMSLISVTNDSLLWSGHYERDIKDVFAVQDEIARSVASQLRITLAGPSATLARTETADREAHDLYLRGLQDWNRRNARTLHQAINLFQQALQRDPRYARAYAGIGLAYVVLPIYDDVPTDSMLSMAVAAAHHALAIDSTLPEAHAIIAYASATRFENSTAAGSFARAVELDSNYATAHFWRSLFLGHVGPDSDAMRELDRALALEPASLVILGNRGRLLYNARDYAAADSAESEAVAVDPTFDVNLLTRASILIERGRAEEAIAILQSLVQQPNIRSAEKLGLLAYAYARGGHAAQARATLKRLPSDTTLSTGAAVAAALDALGDRDAAVAEFRRAVAQHEPWLFIHDRATPYDGLRKDPRLASVFAKIEATR